MDLQWDFCLKNGSREAHYSKVEVPKISREKLSGPKLIVVEPESSSPRRQLRSSAQKDMDQSASTLPSSHLLQRYLYQIALLFWKEE